MKKALVAIALVSLVLVSSFFAYGYWSITREKIHYCKEGDFGHITINQTPNFFHKFYGISPKGGSKCLQQENHQGQQHE